MRGGAELLLRAHQQVAALIGQMCRTVHCPQRPALHMHAHSLQPRGALCGLCGPSLTLPATLCCSHVARFVAFVAGSAEALLLFVTLLDERLLERDLFGRQIVW